MRKLTPGRAKTNEDGSKGAQETLEQFFEFKPQLKPMLSAYAAHHGAEPEVTNYVRLCALISLSHTQAP